MKKVLALVLTLALLLPAAGLAQETVNVLNWYDYIDESVFQLFEEGEEDAYQLISAFPDGNWEPLDRGQSRNHRRMLPLGLYCGASAG